MLPVRYWGLDMCFSNRLLTYMSIALCLIFCMVWSKPTPQKQTTPNNQGVRQSGWFLGKVYESEMTFQYVKILY